MVDPNTDRRDRYKTVKKNTEEGSRREKRAEKCREKKERKGEEVAS